MTGASTIKNLRTVRAVKGQSLTIDLGKTFTGTLSAWMKRKPTDKTYRSFTIVDNRYLFLPKEKTQDLSATDLAVGKWYFDVRYLAEGTVDPNDEEIIYTGTILFSDNITDSNGVEVETVPETESGMINLSNTSTVYGTVGQVVAAKDLIIEILELKAVKAMRSESLTIDLGESYAGYKLEAWMKRGPNSITYRSFTIVDDRYLFLPKEKTQDYYDKHTNLVSEKIEGKWFFDVRKIPDNATSADDESIVTKGVIDFSNNITNSVGQELSFADRLYNKFINLDDTPLEYAGSVDKVLKVNSTEDALEFAEITQDKHYSHDQGVPSRAWVINHGLNKYPSAVAVDSAKTVVVGEIEYIDLNNLTITFNASFSGSAYLN
mgnify:CR=1 FL=1